MIKCRFCSEEFSNETAFSSHSFSHIIKIDRNGKVHKCEACGKEFAFKSAFETHYRMHHTEEKPYVCHICKKAYSLKSSLVAHGRVHKKRKPYKCNVCKKLFRTKSNLIIQIHADIKERLYVCNRCDNGSSRSPSPLPCSGPEDLPLEEECSEHEEQDDSSVKENSDNFVCNICNEVFSHPTNLRTHVLNHKKLKPYICKVCDKRFKKQVSLDRHKAQGDCRESDENNESLELKKDQSAFEKKVSFCDSCISLLSVEQNSLRSLNYNFTHSNAKKGYICNICSKSFLFKQEFDEHYPNHTKYKPYPCDLCDRAFSCENSLKFHYKSHK